MKNLCIIPARGGSKRIPRKNVRLFWGKPMLAYSIDAAKQSGLFDDIMVSTDDEEIAEVFATTADVLKEVLDKYQELGQEFDNFCCFYATAPLVQSKDVVSAFKLLQRSDFTCVYPVVQFSYPIWRCLDLAADGTMARHWPEYENSRSQDLPKEYHDTGTFYWYKTKEWLSGNVKVGGIEVDETTVQDIDTETDWKLAEMKFKLLYGK